MGMEIGYNVWDKNIEAVTLPKDEIDFVCGRCDATYAWFNKRLDEDTPEGTYNEITFNSTMDMAYVKDKYGTKIHLRYVPFADFKDRVMETLNRIYKEHKDDLLNARKEIAKAKEKIKTYQALQQAAQTGAAFDGFQEVIKEQEDQIDYYEDYLSTADEDDYDYSHALLVEEMLFNIAKRLDAGEIVSAYCSY